MIFSFIFHNQDHETYNYDESEYTYKNKNFYPFIEMIKRV